MSYESDLGMEYCGGLVAKTDKPYTVVGTTTVTGLVKVVWIGAESAQLAFTAARQKLGDLELVAVFSGFVARADVAEAKKARP